MITLVRHCSEVEALGIKPEPHIAMISITDVGCKADIADGFGALLQLELCNAEFTREMLDNKGLTAEDLREKGFPRREEAEKALAFLEALRGCADLRELVVHCHRKRRSAAVARFASERLRVPLESDYEGYNETLYALLHHPFLFDTETTTNPQEGDS